MQDPGKIYGRGIAFPPRIGPSGRWMWSEGSRNVSESIQIILQTEMSERILLAQFGAGLRMFLFEPNSAETHRLIEERVQRALGAWEPRIRVTSLQVTPDAADPQSAVLTLSYRLVATGQEDQINVTLQLGG